MDQNEVSFMLSTEELFYSLRFLELPNLPGLGEKPFGEITSAELGRLMEATYSALISRNVLILESDMGFRIDKLIGAALAACAKPEQVMVTTYQIKQEPICIVREYFAKGLAVRQENPMSTIFQFQVSECTNLDSQFVLDAINNISEKSSSDNSSKIFIKMHADEFEEIRQKSAVSTDEAQKLLVKQKIKPKQAELFIELFQKPDFRLTVQTFFQLDSQEDIRRQCVLSAGFAKENWWLIQGDSQSNGNLQIEQTTRENVGKAVVSVRTRLLNHGD